MRAETEAALRRLDYTFLADWSGPAVDDEERYWMVRARLVLGRYDEAERLLSRPPADYPLPPTVRDFLGVQLRAFRREDRRQCLIDALALLPKFSWDSPFRGEVHAFIGYLHQLLDEFTPSNRCYRHAVQAYRESGRESCAAVALFNLCVALDHLNARDLLESATQELAMLARKLGHRSVRVLSVHLGAYRAIDREEYPEAIAALREVFAVSQIEGRRRESGAVAWLLLYVYLKLDDREGVATFLESIASIRLGFTVEYRTVLEELESLAARSVLDSVTAQNYRRRWKRLSLDSSPLLFLTDLIIERLIQGSEYEAALKWAGLGRRWILERQTALPLLDFRYHEAVARMKLGDLAGGRRLLLAFEHDAQEAGAPVRLEKARRLRLRFFEGTQAGVLRCSSVTLDIREHELHIDGTCVDLRSKMRIESLLECLIRRGEMMPLEEAFRTVYGYEFSPLRHEARFNSLIARTRRELGAPSCLIRRDGKIGLYSRHRYELREGDSDSAALRIERRRQTIGRFLRAAARPLAISDLITFSDVSRRTLQGDLRALTQQRRIQAFGQTRGRLYSAPGGDGNPL